MGNSIEDRPSRIGTGLLISIAIAAATLHLMMARAAEPKKAAPPRYLSPIAMVADKDSETIYIAQKTAGSVAVFDIKTLKVAATINIGQPVSGIVISPDKTKLYVTAGGSQGRLCVVDIRSRKVLARIPVGHTPMSPVVSRDGKTAYVCNRFSNTVSVIDLSRSKAARTIPAGRQPVSIDLAKDGSVLLAANSLPSGPGDADYVAAGITVVPTAAGKDISTITLPNGSTNLRSIRISPDGTHAILTHALCRFHIPVTQVERGRVNTNAITLIHVGKRAWMSTLLLDDVDEGTANPWAVAWSDDSTTLCVTHAGTHDISVIDFQSMLAKTDRKIAGNKGEEIQNDLSFLVDLRRRIKLAGNGPRCVAIVGKKAYVGEYFTDSLSILDISPNSRPMAKPVALGPRQEMSNARRGEMLFNSAELCFQRWFSCATCHPGGGDCGLNWDLMHDGMGNPKNTKSLLLSHKTPPSMITGIRKNAKITIMAKIRFVQFSIRPRNDFDDIYAYFKSLKPTPSPRLVEGKLSPSAQRGRTLFKTARCASCHSGELYTDLKKHDIGTGRGREAGREFDTPTLIEAWRTAPYLHDGRALTILDVLSKKHNPGDLHGETTNLSKQELADLAEFVMSL